MCWWHSVCLPVVFLPEFPKFAYASIAPTEPQKVVYDKRTNDLWQSKSKSGVTKSQSGVTNFPPIIQIVALLFQIFIHHILHFWLPIPAFLDATSAFWPPEFTKATSKTTWHFNAIERQMQRHFSDLPSVKLHKFPMEQLCDMAKVKIDFPKSICLFPFNRIVNGECCVPGALARITAHDDRTLRVCHS